MKWDFFYDGDTSPQPRKLTGKEWLDQLKPFRWVFMGFLGVCLLLLLLVHPHG